MSGTRTGAANLVRPSDAGGARRAWLRYLLMPRRVPGSFMGKTIWIVVGMLVGLGIGPPPSVLASHAILGLLIFELVICQGKYVLNDYLGRQTDHLFAREGKLPFPDALARLSLGVGFLRVTLGVADRTPFIGPPLVRVGGC